MNKLDIKLKEWDKSLKRPSTDKLKKRIMDEIKKAKPRDKPNNE